MQLVWSLDAIQDLVHIRAYIADNNPAAAQKVAKRIEQVADTLSKLPNIGKQGRVAGTREFAIDRTPYIAIYRIRGEQLEILRVLHGRRQWPESE